MKTLKTLALIGALTTGSSVMATSIDGTIQFNANTTISLVGGTTFPTATGIDFADNVNSATVNTAASDGSFTGLSGTVAFKDFTIGTSVNSLWSVGIWSFDLGNSVNNSADDTHLAIDGTGTLKGTGFADTPGVFSLTTQRTGGTAQTTFTFSASTTAVPDGGASALLIGMGLLGLGVMRRKA
jgi:hypothetical protein